MKTLTTKDNKSGREITLPAPSVLNLRGQELIKALGQETVDAYLLDKVKIATRAKVRNMLAKTGDDFMSDEAIKTAEDWKNWQPEYRAPVDKTEKALKTLKGLSPEELKSVLASIS